MKAVHFGAGNIGRGFIGYLLSKSDYDITFVDISDFLVDNINKYRKYKVITLSDSKSEEEIDNVKAVSLNDSEKLEQIILETDLITTSIGANNLKSTGKLLSNLLVKRFKQGKNKPLDIIACENALFATNILKESILDGVSEDFKNYVEKYVGFPNSAVDRIVPNVKIKKELPIDVAVEDFYEWDIEKNSVKINKNIKGADYVENLEPYLERKLFLLNGAHAATAYIGYLRGYKYIHEAIKDKFIRNIAIGFHKEAIQALSKKHNLNIEDLNRYSEKLIKRFENFYLQDELYRVGRDPVRKLSSKDRLITPLKLCYNLNMKYDNILYGIAAGFLFNYNKDEKAKEIQESISEKGIDNTICDVTGLKEEDLLVNKIEDKYKELVAL
ncbi:mannitol-1-phosphate 5-dehydrogenase [Clostridium pasteurianum DSM 525 = ATCC 6013]|uniref:Mannitol-1-phosphate 5-dehydrogenase n=1 Tax=Clostridium pasteurianum DSM 525 = ATCC 6013 TaxID=1262449 RepID=A0A0H3J6U6_CLOPA|nr:mannitol-1-phosphate 5-dehydrogenase [Clostridium pasteurianum]AJA48947.1 mannitol-1-phosphate 5-dehydrogenase [Clostridium pasteurianum DSM 525 = ATCC 6013]AJA52935.1 mannitol-1-phosphate 5-dehydrogenase [Clostridium pasteurianum DSM 525 = ATCC 6013]AOZ76156.1 mannitol-1-phosphate 5-dehydrogenase [Clostridium pasteurianum DSM 525 = ATCC 6013]AOZ79952.1 mannitol-1-phosphate 5-dehydrogenase [Clostridium pasteurianum]ELP60243.1 mannitol-1-phosphate 5-dehydrogenase [Clostridium pasteurianum DS